MKKYIAILCAVFLLLTVFSACADPTAPAGATSEPTAATQALPATEPTAPETSAVVPSEPSGTSVTAGGVTVYIDPSAYTPYVPTQALYTRLREGPLEAFEPSPDYGMVYPYTAARIIGSSDNGYSWEGGSLQGLMDQNGRILTDGIYTRIRQMSRYDYETGESTFQPYWITTRHTNAEVHREESTDYSWVDAETRCGVISMDGCFALPDDYVNVEALSEGFCCFRDWETMDFEVYDAQGRLRFTSDKLGDLRNTGWDLDYGEGLYLLSVYTGSDYNEYWFLNEDGDRVLGPYRGADCFHEGLSAVSVAGGVYRFIDKTGAVALPEAYAECGYFRNGRAIVTDLNGNKAVIDRTGRVILTLQDNVWASFAPCGIQVSDGDVEVYYDLDGNKLAEGDYTLCSLDPDTFYEERDGKTRIFRTDGTDLFLEEANNISLSMVLLNGEAVSGYLCRTYDADQGTTRIKFIPRDLSAVIPYSPDQLWYLAGRGYYYSQFVIQARPSGEELYLVWDEDAWVGLRENGTCLRIPLRCSTPVVYSDRIVAVTDQACVMTDLDGNLIFSYPLDAGD